ncbi:nucleotidyltransferase [Candidatus Methylospira mobilis]|uniref:Nucleotidyltransferase n=1 Tax=Candidatus Methylospira mobilis TaxID=1808979 RepID=A0A5Q0BIM7_9GAMM|nr:nucleotidyltransferase substrate binding protein [Candidatus Methylospira mobilis]QFY42014.1 nucleotidyltransferase [Candidatus Methylospira mobilis]WNV03019.1 nucleotidyltransferase substrate binding protein [Candidatus Methylospira mobilis]
MNEPDIRWRQRFANYKKALRQLQNGVELSEQRELSSLEKQGVIQAFEFIHELAWKVLKDFLQDQGNYDIKSSKDATRAAFKLELIADGELWMAMILSRHISSHTYDELTADKLVDIIIGQYFPLFVTLQAEMEKTCHERCFRIRFVFGNAR